MPQISSNVNSAHSSGTFIHTQEHPHSLNLDSKSINIGQLNIQGICGENMSKFSEIKLLLTARENCNLHISGLSVTKLKDHKSTDGFKVDGFQTPFRKNNNTNGGGGLIVYGRNGLNAKRRKDLETNNIP